MNREKIEDVARACHELNRTLCRELGDYSHKLWHDAPDWQRSSACEGVTAIAEGNITRPSDSHAAWSKRKRSEGWVYGEVKDPEAKTHPCLVPFDDLPPEQQLKDHLFFQTAKHLLRMKGIL